MGPHVGRMGRMGPHGAALVLDLIRRTDLIGNVQPWLEDRVGRWLDSLPAHPELRRIRCTFRASKIPSTIPEWIDDIR